ncbi:MAG: zinc dependent phospholipase C family protein [Clostridiales bacterium]|nr:zinc dependent phospholipase C family protein [Clostridiales bacterium]MDY5513576.1 zinc dependent phospholipase C family protein [Candidatus Ventricola sp.]
MPASYVHQCVAEKACAPLTCFAGEPLPSAVLAGAEGPDPLFYALLPLPGGPLAPKVGSILHTQRTDEFLLALCDACKGSALLRAFCCGFFTHYATDTTFHPFVYAHSLTASGEYSSTEHCLLEAGFETLHYRRTGHPSGLPVQFAGYASLSSAQKDEIASALAAAIAKVFPDDALSVRRVRSSFDSAVSLAGALRSPGGRRYRALGAALRPLRLDRALHAHMMPPEPPQADIANDAHAPWSSLWTPDVIRTDSFDDLFAAAVARAGELAQAALGLMTGSVSYASVRAQLGGLSYDSALPWSGSCPPEHAPGVQRRA